VPGGGEVMAARAAAASATSLEELKAVLASFDGCNLRQTAKTLVFADGNPHARVMLIGEAPGREEDEAGLPFVGRSGQLLDRMLAAIGLDRTSVYIANVVPWRPPGNRTPTPQETEICKPFITRQVALARPDLIVFLGGSAAAALAGTTEGILKLRGRWFDYDRGDRRVKALATLHPAYLLRQPLQKRLAWRDFRDLRRQLDGLPARDAGGIV
jgi:DNA polymerase